MNLLRSPSTRRELPFWRRPVILAGLVLGLWAPFKVMWERHIDEEIMEVRYQGFELNHNVRDQLSQNAMIGLLGGFRGVVADLVWLAVTDAWTDNDWYRAQKNIELATTLQPRFVPFWDMGAWHLAYNASNYARHNTGEPDREERLRQQQYWIDEGRKLMLRGLEANPESYVMYKQLGDLAHQKYGNNLESAEWYLKAISKPDAPEFLVRFPAYRWEQAGQDQKAYEYWKMLWNKYLGLPDDPRYAKDTIEDHLRELEEKLNVPAEKRIFSTEKPSPSLNP